MGRCTVPNWAGSGEGRSALPGKPAATQPPRSRQTQGFACRLYVRERKCPRNWRAKWTIFVQEQRQKWALIDRAYKPRLLQAKPATATAPEAEEKGGPL